MSKEEAEAKYQEQLSEAQERLDAVRALREIKRRLDLECDFAGENSLDDGSIIPA